MESETALKAQVLSVARSCQPELKTVFGQKVPSMANTNHYEKDPINVKKQFPWNRFLNYFLLKGVILQ